MKEQMYYVSHSVIESIWKVLSETELKFVLNKISVLFQREPSKLKEQMLLQNVKCF